MIPLETLKIEVDPDRRLVRIKRKLVQLSAGEMETLKAVVGGVQTSSELAVYVFSMRAGKQIPPSTISYDDLNLVRSTLSRLRGKIGEDIVPKMKIGRRKTNVNLLSK